MKTMFTYDGKMATCFCYDKNQVFIGEAVCHDDDMDFASERTGCYIAEGRAIIKKYQHMKNNEIKPALKALKHAYEILKQSTKCNARSHEMRIIRRQIKIKEKELADINTIIKMEKQYLSDYLKNKEIIYTRLRKRDNIN